MLAENFVTPQLLLPPITPCTVTSLITLLTVTFLASLRLAVTCQHQSPHKEGGQFTRGRHLAEHMELIINHEVTNIATERSYTNLLLVPPTSSPLLIRA